MTRRGPFAVPDRIAVDANGYGWRVWGDSWSMVPTNPDNSAPPQPWTWFVRDTGDPPPDEGANDECGDGGDPGEADLLVSRVTWDHIWDVLGTMGAERDSYRDRHASLVGVLQQIAAGTIEDPQAWAKQIVDGIDARSRLVPSPPPGEPDEGER